MSERKTIKMPLGELNEKMGLMMRLAPNNGSKLDHAIRRIHESVQTAAKNVNKKYQEDIEDIRVEYASSYPADYEDVAKRGNLIVDDKGNFSFTRENTKLLNAAIRKRNDEFENTPLEVTPYFANESWPEVKDIDPFDHNKLVGLLFISEIDVESDEYKVEEKPTMSVVSDEKATEPATTTTVEDVISNE